MISRLDADLSPHNKDAVKHHSLLHTYNAVLVTLKDQVSSMITATTGKVKRKTTKVITRL